MAPWLDSDRIADVVRRLAVFGPLPEQAGIDLVKKGELVEFEEGQFLIKQGETSDSALVLMDGVADVLAETKYGSVHLASLQAPALVGEIGVFTNVPRTASIQAKTKVHAVKIGRDDLHQFGQANPAFLSALMLQLGRRFETFNKAIGFYTHALAALERDDFDLALLDDLKHPLPELVDFSRSFLHLAEQITVRRAQREEMANARAIQQGMLPEQDVLEACKAYVDVHALMRPAREVGGDLYDFFLIDPDRLAITIGDVCGKGIPAALFMAMTQTVMRYTLRREVDVGAAATAGNALLAASNREMMFATLFCCVLDLSSGTLSYCSCGHGSPLILRNGNGIEKTSAFNPPLAIGEKTKYKTNSLVLEPGDRLLLYTDGFSDAINKEELRFGDERLQQGVEKVRSLPSEQFIRELVKEVDDFVGDAAQFDDLTALLTTVIARKST
jgi:sigma-B regulation protein RsbU (phosphoserine phosphatase)